MNKKSFIKGVYFYGTFLDGLMGVLMVISIYTRTLIIPYSSTSNEYQFAMGWAASLMFGWTVLLFWGSFKPIARKSILLMTAFPVVSGLILTEIMTDAMGLANIWLFQSIAIMPVLLISYFLSTKIEQSNVQRE
ncbi:MAG: hypothetical protein EU539_02420 [Promethearchaeota archaeon]|nr:MAG: hypothetical protein EU539_02420 [Candidatus Lokiarchaeota archaeon]